MPTTTSHDPKRDYALDRPPQSMTTRSTLVEKRRPHCCGKQRSSKGGNSIISRPTKHGTPWNCKYPRVNPTGLLVAQHETRSQRIRQRLHHMSSQQNQHTLDKTKTRPNHN